MKKNNIEKEVKIFGTFIILTCLSLIILDIYSIYCFGSIQDLSDIYFFVIGPLLIIAGLGLLKYKGWARKMMLYIMAAHLCVGIYELFNSIRNILPPINDQIKIEDHLWIYAMLAIVIPSIFMYFLPAGGVFYFLSRKEIKDLFQKKQLIAKQINVPPLSCEDKKEAL